MKVKEESENEKVGLRLNIQKSKMMASRPITSWEIDGETVETVSDFIFCGSKITADGYCSPEIKIFVPWKKIMTNLDSLLKSRDFIFLASKVTADGDCSHEIKRCSLLGRKVMTNLDSIFKGRDITLPTKVCLVKAMVFPVVMYGCASWTVKKAERRRIDAFELWY